MWSSTRLCQTLEGQDRPGRDHQAKPRRLGQAGPLHHRRAGRRCGHPGTGGRHRCLQKRRLDSKDWQKRLPHNASPYTSTIVLAGAPGQPEKHQGLGRPDSPGRESHHPQPQDLGWRPLELPGRLGICQAQIWQRGQGQGICRQAVWQRAGAGHRRARLDHHLCAAQPGRCADCLGKRSLSAGKRIWRQV
jgi:hypothetical protein